MKERVQVQFKSREGLGKGACRKLRSEGMVPAVVYGPGYQSGKPGFVNEREVYKVCGTDTWETTVIELNVDGNPEMALIREIQRHPLTRDIVHLDFLQMKKDHKVRVQVPVHLMNKGICVGVKQGGVLEQHHHELTVEVFPEDIPERVDIDVKGLELGAEVRISDLNLGDRVHWALPTDTVIVAVRSPEEESEAQAGEAQEVEVLAKGKAKKGE
ncbi:50S ribosomal protein L25/general stress protein Ctc [Thermanaerovibrio acidaminovorans]|uniref:50S ribosomal protein L25/general stress protein Ctc n=1 Tax=Thermanaerovibrio acidaminovorans TaxID=81462 RepID=UPI0024921408|nr:50S ribosomal protein L25/general stress protein Ctc [Thermanaerovibrio acidaminovorans]